jgi:hypothetical protein
MVAAALSLTGAGSPAGASGGEAHFSDKATDTLAPLLYAAFHAGRSMVDVADWLYRADPADPLDLLHLNALSAVIGSYDRTMTSSSDGYSSGNWMQPGQRSWSTTTSTQRQPIMEPGQIAAQIPRGHALLIDGTRYSQITLGPWWDTHSPWRQIEAATRTPLPHQPLSRLGP